MPITDPAADAVLLAASDRVPSDAPTGLVEHMDGSLREKVVVDANMLPASREQYRRLAAALHHAQAPRA